MSDTISGEFPMAPNFPVIVVHLPDENYPKLTACGPALMPDVPPAYTNYPRYQCPACFRRLIQEVSDE